MRAPNLSIISYSELNKRILNREISPVYIFSGNQVYLMERSVENLKNSVLGPSADFNFSLFYGDSALAKDIINAAKTCPMLSKMRLVVIKNADKLPPSELRPLEQYLSQPSFFSCVVLIFADGKRPNIQNKEGVAFVDFTLDKRGLHKTIIEEARKRGFEITIEASETLTSLIGEELQEIQTEIEKLILISPDKKRIDAKDVERLIQRTQFEDVFGLINAIIEKDKKRALKTLLVLESKSEEPISLLNTIGWRFRLIWKVKELLDRKVSDTSIRKELKLSPGAFYYIKKEVRTFRYEDVSNLFDVLSEGDNRLKRTHVPKNMNLTRLVLKLSR